MKELDFLKSFDNYNCIIVEIYNCVTHDSFEGDGVLTRCVIRGTLLAYIIAQSAREIIRDTEREGSRNYKLFVDSYRKAVDYLCARGAILQVRHSLTKRR